MESEKMNIKLVENFLSEYQCNSMIKMAVNANNWDKTKDEFWNDRVFNDVFNLKTPIFEKQMRATLNRVRKVISEHYNVSELWNDGFAIVRWFPGMQQTPHTDDMKSILGDNEDNTCRHRDFGAIIYLNDDFDGGETYYPQHNFSVKPKIGRLAIHPGDSDHEHGVSEIKNNTRYTLASFWTTNRKYSNENE